MRKVLLAIYQKNVNSVILIINNYPYDQLQLKDYFKRFLGLNVLGWKDQEGNTLLHLCVGINFIEGAEFLINMGANINAQNVIFKIDFINSLKLQNLGNTPLHNAKYLNINKMVDFLIRYNAR